MKGKYQHIHFLLELSFAIMGTIGAITTGCDTLQTRGTTAICYHKASEPGSTHSPWCSE